MRKITILYIVASALLSLKGIAQSLKKMGTVSPVKVFIQKTDSGYQLMRDNKPYFVRGAAGDRYMNRIPEYGGNSFRTWSTRNAQQLLDSAHKYGLTALMGLAVSAERHGFDYNDTAKVAEQLARLRVQVQQLRGHPALLAWGIGNELNLQYKNPKVWQAVNDISLMIHALDPNHPTSTILAGINKAEVDYIRENCRDIDFLGINTYGGLSGLPKRVRDMGWDGPYMVTEWGPTGHWEGLTTTWNSPVEESSSEKAAVYKSRYEYSVERDKEKCMGSYVFLWGQKQERTPTWYGLFTEKGEESEPLDVMQYLWTGSWPANKAPHIYSLRLHNKKALDNIYLAPGRSYEAKAVVVDPDNDALTYRWELLPEPVKLSEGGDREDRPAGIENSTSIVKEGVIRLKAPSVKGAYRLFVYVSDGHNNVATANVPFYCSE